MNHPSRIAAAVAGAALIGLPLGAAAEMQIVKLRSYSEVPSISSVATGHLRAFIDERAGTITYELSYAGLEGDVTASHIHVGQAGVNGGVSAFLCQVPAGAAPLCPQSGTVTGTLTAANVIGPAGQGVAAGELAELIEAIRAGVAYVNVHSTKFPSGEIRGQF